MSAAGAEIEVLIVQQHYEPFRRTFITATDDATDTASAATPIGNALALHGWALAETTGSAAAALRIRDGSTVAGETLARINLAANESTRDYFGNNGIQVRTGKIFIEIIAGSIEGVLYWRTGPRGE
jgi:hypothetical protein